ncbi:MAG: glycosyltransferase family protein [Magnetococcales bacterium]|nr:glycosyltransferase family protein [Magnetococcales bacterium]
MSPLERALHHHAAGRLAEAQALYQEILAIHPEHPDALHLLGVVAHQVGRDELALPLIQHALTLRPDHPESHNNLGNVQRRLGHFTDAVASFTRALALKPHYPEAHNNLGNVFREMNRLEEAVTCYHRALTLNPNYADAHVNLGMALWRQGLLAEAVASLQQGIRLAPNVAGGHLNLGNVLVAAGRLNEAVASYRQALTLQPESAEVHMNLGNALVTLESFDEGLHHLHHGLSLNPASARGHYNLGNGYQKMGLPEQAIPHYRQAIRLQPDFPDARFNEGLSHLLLGALTEGWAGYEWRWQSSGFIPHGHTAPPWRGESLAGRTLLLHCEQGFGDSIQFIRFVPRLKMRGGRVVLWCPPALKRLFSSIEGIDTLVSTVDDLPPACDCQLPLMSLPHVLGVTLETLPASIPYLSAEPELLAEKRLPSLPGLKVGVVWRGDPRHGNDRHRSLEARALAVLTTVPGCCLIGLQKDVSVTEGAVFAAMGERWLDLSEGLHDFAHTAAVIAQLDLVIGVDTAVVHLAGALGCPAWLLLPRVPDWRWFLDRDDSPWYPGMRLFRQRVRGNWDAVLLDVVQALRVVAGS